MQKVLFTDLGRMEYRQAWDYQEGLLRENVRIKTEQRTGDRITGSGAILHTVNPRLFPEQVRFIIDDAAGSYVFFDLPISSATFAPSDATCSMRVSFTVVPSPSWP